MSENNEKNNISEKEAMQRHYDYYKKLSESGELTEADEEQWSLAQQRKNEGLVE